MKVLITGGAGFVGSHLADRLLAEEHKVCVIDNYTTGRRDNLPSHPGLQVVEGTIADQELVNGVFDEFGPSIVVHSAASYKDPNNWYEDSMTNVVGTANVVQASKRVQVTQLIYFQTALCYGLRPLEQPIKVEHPIFSEGSSYAITKTAGEQYVMLSGLNWISFRLANAYGPRNLSGPLPTFYHRLSNQKPCFVMDTRRDFVFIDDLIEVVLMAINGAGQNGVYHISSGTDYAIKDLFTATVQGLGITLDEEVEVRPRNPDDAFTILLDPSKTLRDFPGWSIHTSLEKGVKETIDWYTRFGISQTFTHLKPLDQKE